MAFPVTLPTTSWEPDPGPKPLEVTRANLSVSRAVMLFGIGQVAMNSTGVPQVTVLPLRVPATT